MREKALFSSASTIPLFFLALLFMAVLASFAESSSSSSKSKQPTKRSRKKIQKPPSSWDQIKNMFTCKQIENTTVHDPSKPNYAKLSSCSSICSFRDVVHGNTRVVDRADNSPENSSLGQDGKRLLRRKAAVSAAGHVPGDSGRSVRMNGCGGGALRPYTASNSSAKGMQLKKLSGCYECHMIVDPSRFPSPRTRVCACSQCGEVFPKIESLEHHQAIKHAVSELGPEDSGRNIVEIIFKSSWLKKDNPICKIERIMKVHNTQRTIQRFEDCRDAVKARATANTKKNPRCAADGNELLRFHCTSLSCALGARGSSSLCGSVPGCGVCTIIRHGFQRKAALDVGKGVRTTASSGRAHDIYGGGDSRRAMLVCRVIAGKVKHVAGDAAAGKEEEDSVAGGAYDSVAGEAGVYSNLEELYVFNPRAILPCFVVIYKAMET